MSFVTSGGYDVARPSTAPTLATGASGAMGVGLYSYKVTFVTAFGETDPSVASSNFATATGGILVSAIALSADNNVFQRKLYRTTSGGSSWALVTTLTDNITTTYSDIIADGSLTTAAPTFNTASSRAIERGYCAHSTPGIYLAATGITATAAGGQTNAAQLASEYNFVTVVASAADSVKLPALTANLIGMKVVVRNNGANATNIFPFLGQFINALAVNTASSLAASTTISFVAVSATTWLQY